MSSHTVYVIADYSLTDAWHAGAGNVSEGHEHVKRALHAASASILNDQHTGTPPNTDLEVGHQNDWQATLPTSTRGSSLLHAEAQRQELNMRMSSTAASSGPQPSEVLSFFRIFPKLQYIVQFSLLSIDMLCWTCLQGTHHGVLRGGRKLGAASNSYFRHGDVIYPFLYLAAMGGVCSSQLVPPWLIILLMGPLYVGGVKLVIVKGEASPVLQ